MARMFAIYAAASLVIVVALGFALAASYRTEARHRGVAEGRSEALLVAETAVEPILDGRPLAAHLSPSETSQLDRLVARSVRSGTVLRLRLRDLAGNVVFSDDGSGFRDKPEDEALEAAHGEIVAELTHLNADSNDTGPIGPEAVEVYLPLEAGVPSSTGRGHGGLPPLRTDQRRRDLGAARVVPRYGHRARGLVPHPLRSFDLLESRAAPAGEA